MSLIDDAVSIGLRRRFTLAGVHPYDQVTWERRDARLVDWRDGTVAFEQLGVEFPAHWSVNASNIVAQKYFRGKLGTAERESSLRQLIDRVVETITVWGARGGYFADAEEESIFRDELTAILVQQRMAFNSPVWFNIGVDGAPNQSSACFILSVEDSMDSILNWYREEGTIFKGGSGAGVNLSKIRSSKEFLTGGGHPSGPVSFMRGADSSAGTIKSGGKTRRAAKMAILDVDHPDVAEFIWCKAKEERKARVLRDAGFDMDLDGADSISIQYQNANNSVRVTDEFMRAVLADEPWHLRAVTSGEVIETVPARELFTAISTAAWECADPGLQFDSTINRWHTTPASGRINGSNPCFPASARVHTDHGQLRFDDLIRRTISGEQISVYTHEATSQMRPTDRVLISAPEAVMVTGHNPIVRLRFANGAQLRCTPGHKIFTANRSYVAAEDLTPTDEIRLLDLPTPATEAPRSLGVAVGSDLDVDEWTPELANWLGWLVAHGSIDGSQLTTRYPDGVFGAQGAHALLLEELTGVEPKLVQRDGISELRVNRPSLAALVQSLGAVAGHPSIQVVPAGIHEAPDDIVAAFLRAVAPVASVASTTVVAVRTPSPELARGVQRLLSGLGVLSSIREIDSVRTVVVDEGSVLTYSAQVETVDALFTATTVGPVVTTRLVERTDDGVELTFNLSEPRNHSYVVDGIVVRNCSEYMHLDNSACNLASLNLLTFLDEDGRFDVEGFRSAVEVTFLAQEILVANSDYPTEAIGDNARRFRQLGLGFTNLGAMLMALGLPYESDGGRAWAGAISALMTGHAYATSARVAGRMGPFEGYADNEAPTLRVLDMHRSEAREIDEDLVPAELLSAAQRSWDDACLLANDLGIRNAQATVIAPTGTISFLMDCDTTGIEPDLGLVKTKKLVGGGSMQIVNQTVPRALRRLGYDDAQSLEIIEWIAEHHSALGAPHLSADHVAVFACSMGDNVISADGHIRMMAAVQPFISGAISKTVNLPESATIADVEALHIESWKLGLKAVAIYRDNCKVGQPLSTGTSTSSSAETATALVPVEVAAPLTPLEPTRERMPRSRVSRTMEFRVADCKGFVTIGEYADGRPGELFIRVSKQGSTLAGIMDAFAIAVSHGLQYGVPLRSYVDAFVGMRFEPAGMTDDPELRIANSLMDYLFRRLALEYLSPAERSELGIFSVSERVQPTLPGVEESTTLTSAGIDIQPDPPSVVDAPLCMQCGVRMQRAGSCYTCGECGSTSGCS